MAERARKKLSTVWQQIKWTHKDAETWDVNGDIDLEKFPVKGDRLCYEDKVKEMRLKKIKEHVQNLISSSTIHGLHYCFDKRHFLRRILWFLVLVVAVGFLIDKLVASVKRFFDFPFTTKTTIKYQDSMVFPAVSICNTNDLRNSVMNGTKLDSMFGEGFQEKVRKGGITGEEYANTTESAQHNLHQMLQHCEFKQRPCNTSSFTSFYNSVPARCYTFNSGKCGPVEVVNGVGGKNSLTMMLNVEHYDYHRNTDKVGIRLTLHDQNESPIKMPGIFLSPGMLAYVSVSKRVVTNLPAPYKTNCGSLQLHYSDQYSLNYCWLDFLTRHVEKTCNCRDYFMPGKSRVCSINESISCMWPAWESFEQTRDYHCPLPCKIETYATSLSFGLYPSNIEADRIAETFNLSGSKSEKRRFIRDNFLKVVIYYEDLSYELMEQEASYDLMVLLGDIGGQLGLFLGSSILTYLEIVDCIAMVIYTKYFELFKPRPARL